MQESDVTRVNINAKCAKGIRKVRQGNSQSNAKILRDLCAKLCDLCVNCSLAPALRVIWGQ
jgi:hypothetical protein